MLMYSSYENDQRYPKPQVDDRKEVFYAYIGGAAHECSSHAAAKAISKNVERVILNADDIREQAREVSAWRQAYHVRWKEDLRLECQLLSSIGIFDKAFEYVRSHEDNFDMIPDYLEELEEIIELALIKSGVLLK